MENHNLFELATQYKYRYKTSKGEISTEDLWDVPYLVLDDIYRTLKKDYKELDDAELLSDRDDSFKKQLTIIENKMAIVRYIHDKHKKEVEDSINYQKVLQHNRKIEEIIARKKDKELENMSIEELQGMLKSTTPATGVPGSEPSEN